MINIIKFTAPWCQPCKKYTPILEEWVSSRDDVRLSHHVDIDVDPDTAAHYGVQGVPFTLFMDDRTGKTLAGVKGSMSKSQLNKVMDRLASNN